MKKNYNHKESSDEEEAENTHEYDRKRNEAIDKMADSIEEMIGDSKDLTFKTFIEDLLDKERSSIIRDNWALISEAWLQATENMEIPESKNLEDLIELKNNYTIKKESAKKLISNIPNGGQQNPPSGDKPVDIVVAGGKRVNDFEKEIDEDGQVYDPLKDLWENTGYSGAY